MKFINRELTGFTKPLVDDLGELAGADNLREQVELALELVKAQLKSFASEPGFESKMQLAFGEEIEVAALGQAWAAGDFSIIPQIQIVSATDINGANGAFARQTNRIYLAQEFLLANQLDIDAIAAVLLEEYGHFVDSEINLVDVPGDEGAIFSALARGETLNKTELQQLRAENDVTTVVLDDHVVEIEHNKELINIIQLTNDNLPIASYQISGNNVVWLRSRGNDGEIFLYDGSSITQLTNDNLFDNNPQISGNNVVWERSDGNDTEIFLYDGSSITQLTNDKV